MTSFHDGQKVRVRPGVSSFAAGKEGYVISLYEGDVLVRVFGYPDAFAPGGVSSVPLIFTPSELEALDDQ